MDSNSDSFQASPKSIDGSDAKVVVADPRWPWLNRWSSPISSKPSSMESPPLAPKLADVPASLALEPDASHQSGASATLSLGSEQQDVSHQSGSPSLLSEVLLKKMSSPQVSEAPPASICVSPSIKEPPPVVSHVSPVSMCKGAWEKPLPFCSNSLRQPSELFQHFPVNSQWPDLVNGRNGVKEIRSKFSARPSEQVSESDAAIKTCSKDYPWAAKMNQSLRNLQRVTIPEYMEDGTPKVRIPSHVLLGGVENQKEFVVGQFYRCYAPSSGQIQAVVSRIWGKKCRIFIRKLGESNYLFHIPDESTRKWVLQRGLWHVDDCLMFVSPWSTNDTISVPEITTVPVWLTLNNIPDQLYSFVGIKWIASGIGEPMLTEKPWLDPTQMGKAKILVEVKLDRPFPQRVALIDRSDAITMVDVIYSWLPSTCSGCGQLGHKVSRCLLKSGMSTASSVLKTAEKLRESSQLKKDNGKAPIVAELPIIEAESLEKDKSLNNVPITTSLACVQEDIAQVTTSSPASATLPLGSSPIQSVKSTAIVANACCSPIITSSVLAQTVETISTEETSLPATHVERSIRRSLSSAAMKNNRFSSLDSSEDEEDIVDVDNDLDQAGFLTPAGKRILRERPVKPSAKAKEMNWHQAASGRGNRGRGNRGGRG